MRLVGPAGEQVGIVKIEDALRLALEADLDLVEVAPTSKPPVCKIMDFGKFKYEAALKDRESRRNQSHTVIKEMKLRPKIDSHDYETKKGHVTRFLLGGDKVKITIMFRGREQSRPELGIKLLGRLAEDVAEIGFVEAAPKQDGRNMLMVLAPLRKKSEGKKQENTPRIWPITVSTHAKSLASMDRNTSTLLRVHAVPRCQQPQLRWRPARRQRRRRRRRPRPISKRLIHAMNKDPCGGAYPKG